MKIGILSETHGHAGRTKTACAILKKEGVNAVCHCGDVGSEQILIELAGAFGPEIPVYVILGNVDLWDTALSNFPDTTGVRMLGTFGKIELEGKKIALAHGHDPKTLDSAIHSGDYDYVLTGHTHEKADWKHGDTRVINPGAVYRAAENTVAVLDPASDELRFLTLSF